MNFFRTLILIAISTLGGMVHAQTDELYMPIEYKMAFEKGTRTWDGTVSDQYYQNNASYDIKAKVDPATRQLEASAKITYTNNFQEDLKYLAFHAYKDLYDEGMIIKSLKIEGEKVGIESKAVYKSDTYYMVFLENGPLPQGESLEMNIEWSITIPAKVDRDGAYDETSMLVAYWYPEIAVYDDVFGWDLIDFDGKAEFYHDVSDFDVEIEIPDNFVIWASDAPINGEEVYPGKIWKKLGKAKGSDEKVTIIPEASANKGVRMKSNVWKYSVKGFPDFTFAFSDRFVWEARRYSDQFGEYFLNSAYPPENKSFSVVLQNEVDAMEIFHNEFPKYPFPYKHFVAFNGEHGGGMEFPGMCNDQARVDYSTEGIRMSDYDANKLLTVHEMMHMYFPFLMGINEKRYAWMDEGMAEFAEDEFTNVNLESYKSRHRFATSDNVPLMTETYSIPKTYGVLSYDFGSQSYHALMHLLGKEMFDKCLKEYMDRWKNKHPSPYDFFFTFNDISGQNLNWFWKAWYFEFGYPDVAVDGFENGLLTIKNEGGYPIATKVEVTYEDGSVQNTWLSPVIWKESNAYQFEIGAGKNAKKIELKTLNGADAIWANNFWTTD